MIIPSKCGFHHISGSFRCDDPFDYQRLYPLFQMIYIQLHPYIIHSKLDRIQRFLRGHLHGTCEPHGPVALCGGLHRKHILQRKAAGPRLIYVDFWEFYYRYWGLQKISGIKFGKPTEKPTNCCIMSITWLSCNCTELDNV